jgi:small subunit ribosomal protein S16
MATVIRFSRHGSKKRPYLRMVVQDSRFSRDGRFIEHIGAFDPVKGDTSLVVKRDRLEYWLSVGAQMSETVKNCLKPMINSWKNTPAQAPEASHAKA